MIYPITHYEYILRDPQTYLGWNINEFRNLMDGDEFDFLDFKKRAEQEPMFRLMFASGVEQGNMAVRMAFHILSMMTYGEKIYYISKEVCRLLLDTKLTIDAEFLESPFPEIYIYLDQSHFTITDFTGTKPLKGIYVNLQRESDGIKKMRFLATSGPDGIEDMSDVNYFACFHVPDRGDLETICNNQIEKYKDHRFGYTRYPVCDTTLADIFRFCVNALIYIGCRNANLSHIIPLSFQRAIEGKKSPKKIRKIERNMKRQAQKPFIYVSHNWGEKEDREAHSGRKLDHEVLVSGHWRGQWKGSDSTGDRRREVIRIASYIKGIGKEKVNKKYIVN